MACQGLAKPRSPCFLVYAWADCVFETAPPPQLWRLGGLPSGLASNTHFGIKYNSAKSNTNTLLLGISIPIQIKNSNTNTYF